MNEVRITAKENVVVDGVKFKAKPVKGGCTGCAFTAEKFWQACQNVVCSPDDRRGGRSVIFAKKKKKKKNPWIPVNGVVPDFPTGTTVRWKNKQGLKNICSASVLNWNIGTDDEVTHYRVIAQSQSDS